MTISIQHSDNEAKPILLKQPQFQSRNNPSLFSNCIAPLFFIVAVIFCNLLLPVMNKLMFSGYYLNPTTPFSSSGFHYPITSSWIQVMLVSVVLVSGYILSYLIQLLIRNIYFTKQEVSILPPISFPLTRHFFWKCKQLFLVGLLFAINITLYNVGLDQLPLNVSALLKTTLILWVIVLSYLYANETISLLQILFALCITLGAIFLSVDLVVGWNSKSSPDQTKYLIGIAVNLIACFSSALSSVVLKKACKDSEQPPYNMTVTEITTFKMCFASMILAFPSIIVEVFLVQQNAWTVIAAHFQWFCLFTLLGLLLTLANQVLIVGLAAYTKPITYGIVFQLMVFPQLLFFTLLTLSKLLPPQMKLNVLHFTWAHGLGTCLILCGVLCYTLLQCCKNTWWNRKSHPFWCKYLV